MTKEANDGGVTGDWPIMLHHGYGAPSDPSAQFSGAIVAMDFSAHPITALEVRLDRRPYNMTFNRNSKKLALHACQMLAYIVPELGIQRERTRVKAGLDEPDAS